MTMTSDEFMKVLEEVAKSMPMKRYTPDNPPMKDWISNLPIAVPIKPEFIRTKFDLICPFEIDKTSLEKMIEECHTPLQIITTKEKTVMQAKTVFDLYFKRAYEALEKAGKEKLDQLVEEDENTKLIDKTFEQLNNRLTDTPKDFVGFHLFRTQGNLLKHCTGDTRKKVEEWSEKITKEHDWIDRMHEEVEAQLLSCETYEQARSILRIYDIIDNAGEMQEYIPF